ncbi:ATP-binding protein [Alicyclobacillus dauci]|uniref:ATP-binding protein n=1 Tax=Alicyclobacillus dauci TaxID=1475485 RepID=A0ABY6Z8L6_9BACL|nr:ATP-binding protein [Alicyclobacillus dauci]WAH39199.1 ATP-binding protein [Alicyclobacillus dauci]
MTLMFGGREKPFGAKRCTCPEAQEHWRKFDERLKAEEEFRLENERRERIRALFTQSLLPERWKTRTFEAFQVTPENRQAYEMAKAYARDFEPSSPHGLILSGRVGRGKTHLCAAIAMELLSREHSVIFGTVTNLLAQIRNTYSDDKETELKVFQRLTRCRLLVIDELGKEKVTEWVEQTVYEIINTRYEHNKPILVTTNMDVFKLPQKYPNNGEAILSRILEMCRGVQMDGPDWRTKGMKQ